MGYLRIERREKKRRQFGDGTMLEDRPRTFDGSSGKRRRRRNVRKIEEERGGEDRGKKFLSGVWAES